MGDLPSDYQALREREGKKAICVFLSVGRDRKEKKKRARPRAGSLSRIKGERGKKKKNLLRVRVAFRPAVRNARRNNAEKADRRGGRVVVALSGPVTGKEKRRERRAAHRHTPACCWQERGLEKRSHVIVFSSGEREEKERMGTVLT